MQKRWFVRAALTALLSLGLYAIAAPAAVAAPAAGAATVTRMSGETAMAGFEYKQGDKSVFVQVNAQPTGLMSPSGQPLSGPAVSVSITECQGDACGSYAGAASAPGLRFTDLTRVALPATSVKVFPVGDPETPPPPGPPFFVTVALTWIGVGNITTNHVVDHVQISPTAKETFVFHGRTRNATVTGSVAYTSPLFGSLTLTGANANFVQLNAGGVVVILIER